MYFTLIQTGTDKGGRAGDKLNTIIFVQLALALMRTITNKRPQICKFHHSFREGVDKVLQETRTRKKF